MSAEGHADTSQLRVSVPSIVTAHPGRPMSTRTRCVSFVLSLVAFLGLTGLSLSAVATTYYVRVDGGTNVQCTGTSNTPYPGSGTGQACAWSSPMEALPPRFDNFPNAAHMSGGDTLVIGAGSYPIGWTSTNQETRWGDPCDVAYTSGCTLQVVPSGTPSQPTRIVGAGWDTGCVAPPELWGTQGITQLLNLNGSSNVFIACLNLTDHSNCTYNYAPDAAFACNHKWVSYQKGQTPNYGLWAQGGIHAQDSNNVTLQDLNVHGFADFGVQAGRISNWTVTRVKVVGNGNSGWNGDLGGNNHNSTNSGRLLFTDLTIAWNGCQENYPKLGTYINCYGQNENGYGDGFSEAWTGGDFVFIRPRIYNNTQDGIDVLYANGTGSVTVDQGYFAMNAGNDLKTSGNATVTNNIFIAYCSWFKDNGFPAGADSCRAGGGQLFDMTAPGQTVVFAYNTMIGEPNGMFGGDPTYNATSTPVVSSDVYDINNNIFIGVPAYLPKNAGAYPFLAWFGDPPNNPATIKLSNNLVWHIREVPLFNCKTPGIICVDPQLTDETLASFNPYPLVSSPAIGNAIAGTIVTTDAYGNPRPAKGATIGAVEYRGQHFIGSGSGDSPVAPGGGTPASGDAPAASPVPPSPPAEPQAPAGGNGAQAPNGALPGSVLPNWRHPFPNDARRFPSMPSAWQPVRQPAVTPRPVVAPVPPTDAAPATPAAPPAIADKPIPAARSYLWVVYDWIDATYNRYRRILWH